MTGSSIRHQILIPLVAVQLATVATIAVVSAKLATGRSESQVTSRIEGVVETLGRSNFPMTSGVLEKMRGLSGAHFVACSDDGRVLESTLPGLSVLPVDLRSMPTRSMLEGPGNSPVFEIGGQGYFAASMRSGKGETLLVLYPEAAWRRARFEATLPSTALGLLSMASMAGVTGWIAHRLAIRLRSVREQVAAIAAGDFRAMDEPSPGQGDEVDDLIRSVNQMAAQLRAMRQTIRRTERAGALAQLAAGLAHQLRNAATGARLAVQLHARRCPSQGLDGSLDVALRQLSICEDQIKGLLTVGRGEPGRRSRLEAARVVEEVAALVQPICRHLNVSLTSGFDAHFSILADSEQLRAALWNLALNAIEAAGPGGSVSIRATVEPGWLCFDLIDNGPGPPPELADSIFEPFVTSKPEGVGLGLAQANRVAVDLDGELSWIRVDQRTRFRLAIPRDRVEEPE